MAAAKPNRNIVDEVVHIGFNYLRMHKMKRSPNNGWTNLAKFLAESFQPQFYFMVNL